MLDASDYPNQAIWSNSRQHSLPPRLCSVAAGFLESLAQCFGFRRCIFSALVSSSQRADKSWVASSLETGLLDDRGICSLNFGNSGVGFESSDFLRFGRIHFNPVPVLQKLMEGYGSPYVVSISIC